MEIGFHVVSSDEQILVVEKLAQEIWTQHYTPILAQGQVPYMLQKFQSYGAIKKQMDEGLHYFIIADSNQKPMGYLAIKIDTKDCFLSKIYLRESERNKGYGKAAFTYVENEARKQGATNINLTVNKFNKIALDAYLKYGFVNDGPLQIDIGGGYIMDDYKLVKHV